MDIHSLSFYILATVMALAGLAVIRARNPLYNVLSLVLVIFCLSGLFVLLEAYFVGIILLLVYAGAVMVFFLFVVMCLNLNTLSTSQHNRFTLLGWTVGLSLLALTVMAIKSSSVAFSMEPSTLRGTIESIGKILFTEYVLPFELTSLLLLIAVFGIVSLAKGSLSTEKES